MDAGHGLAEPLVKTMRFAPEAHAWSRALLLAVSAIGLLSLLGWMVPNVWTRMALAFAVLVPLALRVVPIAWRQLFSPSPRHLATGVGLALLQYAAGKVLFPLFLRFPSLAADVAAVYGWRSAAGPAVALSLLCLLIVPGEEIVWRAGVGSPLCARLGPWAGSLAGAVLFAAAHLSLGLPLLVIAALLAGFFWNVLVAKTGSAIPGLVCHLLWDVSVLFVWPY